MSLFRPSGGLVYHWRALLNGWRWRSFRRDVAQWLDLWDVPTEELILIGPSGGHTLPTRWLKKFKSIYAYDLDPLAAIFFKLRHRRSAHFTLKDMFWRQEQLSLEPLREVLTAHPQANILFCNVIGQVLLERHADEKDWYKFLQDLRGLLAQRNWASYHDLYSTEKGCAEIDHLTNGEWLEGLTQVRFEWPLSRRNHHSTGAVLSVEKAGVGLLTFAGNGAGDGLRTSGSGAKSVDSTDTDVPGCSP